jgi:RND family efflux transporter MFP subunit
VQSSALTTVITTHPQVEPAFDEIVLPGQVKGEFETPIYARTNGYIRSWRTDIGARVKVGELLAVIDSPEVDQQLRQAEADLNAAQANAAVARGNADRAEQLVVTHSVSRQEAEDRAAAATATAAQVSANLANVGRLRELQSFERVVAPFSGVITARSTDVGALIDAGGTRGTELFRISATDKLRTYVDVPQSYANGIVVGIRATLQFPERPRKTYPATVIRTASAIDPQSRTLTVELNIDNRSGELLPGSFTEAHFRLPTDGHALQLPGNALLFRAEGTQVAAVGPDGRVELKSITLGRDFGTEVEILNGLASSDQVILNPPAAIESGDHVRVASAGAQAQKAGS